jgi:hypothetical protein
MWGFLLLSAVTGLLWYIPVCHQTYAFVGVITGKRIETAIKNKAIISNGFSLLFYR